MDAIVAEHSRLEGLKHWRPERCQRIALMLQGGALGAYQAGVYQALREAEIKPDWVSGVSVGAINSTIIAGHSRKHRLQALRTFWERITERNDWLTMPEQGAGLVVHDVHREHEFP
ncbi:MAG: patatin-like phospholipase family protein [Xanthobacteraceae bacterium]|nr:patatin-like phospholipase family protein [Xanthobacteraceae bacterium]